MDLHACYGYFDSWHTLDHLVNEIPSESHDIKMHSLITHDEFIEVDL